MFNVPAGAIVYTTGATTGTLDGFTFTGAIDRSGDLGHLGQRRGVHVPEQHHHRQPNGDELPHRRTRGDDDSGQPVRRNTGPNPSDGTSIFITNGFVAGMTVQNNLFENNTAPNAADINTPGVPDTPSTGILIQNNTSNVDQTFAVINNTTGTQILNNTILDPTAAAPIGTAILLFSANPGAVVSGNTIDGGIGAGIADSSNPSGPVTVAGNTVNARTVGIRLSQAGATVSNNTVTNIATTGAAGTGIGIWMQAASASGTITANAVSGSAVIDCQDDSVGAGTLGTANTWTSNNGDTSSPAGLCLPPPPTTTTVAPATSTTLATTTTTTPAVVPPGPPTTTPIPPSGELPATGGGGGGPVVLFGLVLLVGGFGLIRLSRRRHAT